MRLSCPICGARDVREFTYRGDAVLMERPEVEDGFYDYVHTRANVAGETAELWHHAMGCSAWLRVVRNTVTHEVVSVELARDVPR